MGCNLIRSTDVFFGAFFILRAERPGFQSEKSTLSRVVAGFLSGP